MGAMARTSSEVADGVHVLNYRYLNQNIGVIVGRDEAAVIDTRSSGGQAREILDDVRRLTHLPVRIVIDTHGHSDHAFGNVEFRRAAATVAIWSHARCPEFLARTGEAQRADTIRDLPDEADDIAALAIEPPDRLVDLRETIDVGGRAVELLYLGRAHTDHDLVIRVPEAKVVFAGDVVVKSDFPFFGDSYPLDFPATVAAIGELEWDALVTGHGGLADRAYLALHAERVSRLAEVARGAHAAGTRWRDAVGEVPLPKTSASDGLRRAYAQLDGTL
jgi:glyoxylase-like metal-dependent hydrolase (beta-lactamase superfamily II)